MSMTSNHITITLDRRLLEHPNAFHVRRMRAAIWLYLLLLGRLVAGRDVLDIDPAELGQTMGLPEGTIRSWLGHLRKARYIDVERLNGARRIRIKRLAVPMQPRAKPVRTRFFTPERLARALGESGNNDALAQAIRSHSDDTLRRALASALAVPATEIRRSRTALFLYLLKRHAEKND
jgi:hypothetical protein